MLLPFLSIYLRAFGLENVEDKYRCGNRIFLAIVMAFEIHRLGGTLSGIGNHIIDLSVCVAKSICSGAHLWSTSYIRVKTQKTTAFS